MARGRVQTAYPGYGAFGHAIFILSSSVTRSDIAAIFKNSAKDWASKNITVHCAALAYYTIFALAPLLVIAVALGGLVFGPQAARGEIFRALHGALGPVGAHAIEAMMQSASKSTHAGFVATVAALITLLFGASGVFSQLQFSLNMIWRVRTRQGCGMYNLIRQRLLSFSMIVVIGFILLVSLIASAALSAIGGFLGSKLPGGEIFWDGLNFVISFGVVTLLFATIFKILPDVSIRWRDVWVGAAFTAFLFDLGKLLIGLYLGRSTIASMYGAAGSLIAILLWAFYSSAIVFFGAEFTRAWATRSGRKIQPKPMAEEIREFTRVA